VTSREQLVAPRLSLALRISLASALFGLAVTGVGLVLGYWALDQQLNVRTVAELRGKKELLEHLISEAPTAAGVRADIHRLEHLLIGHNDLHVALQLPGSGGLLTFTELGRRSLVAFDELVVPDQTILDWSSQTGERLTGLRATGRAANGESVRFVLSVDRKHDADLIAGWFLRASLIGLPLVLLVVGIGAWLIARTSLAPLRRFRGLASSVGTQSLGRRLSLSGLPAELAELGREFNLMLERIDVGYTRLHEFSADLAHEMRTPLATLLGRTQVALSKPRSMEELRDALAGNVGELDRLSQLIADMLFIARADVSDEPLQKEPVDLLEEARRVAEFFSLAADEKGVQIVVGAGSLPVSADMMLVRRAVTNLVSNAIRHAPPRSVVRLEGTTDGSRRVLAVTNDGLGIPPEHQARIFDRFYRADFARTRDDGGSGLGLAIVKSIMGSHSGEVRVLSSAEGPTRFELMFPE
jgi:two-component system, OmpR family, heavy metal sensor histidine kinase CusS